MKKPRILFVDHAGVLGGAELYLLDVVRHLREQSHVVLFEEGPFLDKLKEEGLSVELIKAPGSVMGVERSGGRFDDIKAIPGLLKWFFDSAERPESMTLYLQTHRKLL